MKGKQTLKTKSSNNLLALVKSKPLLKQRGIQVLYI